MSISTSVQTVDRLVRIIDSFSSSRRAWTLTDLSEHLDLPKSTLHRFLRSLEAHGILRQDDESKLWHLGYRLFVWGCLAEKSTALHDVARPIMRDLTADTGETTLRRSSRPTRCGWPWKWEHAVPLTPGLPPRP
jgi:IclR family KDG regulon transcriptional repressor